MRRTVAFVAAAAVVALASAAQAHFLQPDPIGPKDNLNLYGYVGNDPLNHSDPTGTTCTGSGRDLHCQIDGVAVRERVTYSDGTTGVETHARAATAQDHAHYASFEKAYTDTVRSAQEHGGQAASINYTDPSGHRVSFAITGAQLAQSLAGRTMNADPSALYQGGGSEGITVGGRNVSFMGPRILNGSYSWQREATGHEGIHNSLQEVRAMGPFFVDNNAHQRSYNAASELLQGLP